MSCFVTFIHIVINTNYLLVADLNIIYWDIEKIK